VRGETSVILERVKLAFSIICRGRSIIVGVWGIISLSVGAL